MRSLRELSPQPEPDMKKFTVNLGNVQLLFTMLLSAHVERVSDPVSDTDSVSPIYAGFLNSFSGVCLISQRDKAESKTG